MLVLTRYHFLWLFWSYWLDITIPRSSGAQDYIKHTSSIKSKNNILLYFLPRQKKEINLVFFSNTLVQSSFQWLQRSVVLTHFLFLIIFSSQSLVKPRSLAVAVLFSPFSKYIYISCYGTASGPIKNLPYHPIYPFLTLFQFNHRFDLFLPKEAYLLLWYLCDLCKTRGI